ncbi:hypothetical protein [Moorena sp. SIO4G3]|uniref:hypothetical protein n=1 Tax=Moorena sp. SIO4G3 TaxID=2607821 RepID=UPI0014298241|nr:hypothetical protein [Moorena sp. SIO4G3]NEO74785.1 hypothetical protein [Moorena sp. SIO4G3]
MTREKIEPTLFFTTSFFPLVSYLLGASPKSFLIRWVERASCPLQNDGEPFGGALRGRLSQRWLRGEK